LAPSANNKVRQRWVFEPLSESHRCSVLPAERSLSLAGCLRHLSSSRSDEVIQQAARGLQRVVPAAALSHVEQKRALGESHTIAPRSDRAIHANVRYVLDLPLPQQLDTRAYVCNTCKARGRWTSFRVLTSDIQRQCGEVLLHRTERSGDALMTKAFLMFCVHNFHDQLCARALRRTLVAYYSANALAFSLGPATLSLISAVPGNNCLRSMLLAALEAYTVQQCRHMQR
jgi:hypothetical protein